MLVVKPTSLRMYVRNGRVELLASTSFIKMLPLPPRASFSQASNYVLPSATRTRQERKELDKPHHLFKDDKEFIFKLSIEETKLPW